jgi:hypothetical protein
MSPDERSSPESFAIGVEPPMVTETTSPWWEATRERRLLVQCCSRCGERERLKIINNKHKEVIKQI